MINRNTWIVLVGCFVLGGMETLPAIALDQPTSAPAPVLASTPATAPADPSAEAYVRRLAHLMATRQAEAFAAEFDTEGFSAKSLDGVDIPPEHKRALIKGCMDRKPVQHLFDGVGPEASYAFLRTWKQEGKHYAWVRLRDAGGLVYVKLEIISSAGGWHIADIYSTSLGEWWSDLLRRQGLVAALGIATSKTPGGQPPLVRDRMADLPTIEALTRQLREGRPKDALAEYERLSPLTKQQKYVMLLRVHCAQGIDEQTYARALEDMAKAFPDDPCTDLMCVRHYCMRGEFSKALECVDRLDKAVGGDPYLTLRRGKIRAEKGKADQARTDYREAMTADPSLQDAWFALLDLELAQKEFGEAVRLMGQIESRFNFIFNKMENAPIYAEFLKSPEYRQWAATRVARPIQTQLQEGSHP